MSWHDSSGYSVVDLLLCAGNFIFARQPARPLLPASGPERPENFLVGSIFASNGAVGSRPSFAGTAEDFVGIWEFLPLSPVLWDICFPFEK
jgi:hypothetical protein